MIVLNPPDRPSPFPRDALLQHSAAQIGIDQPALGPVDGFRQGGIGDAFLAGELFEPSVLEYPHSARPRERHVSHYVL